MGRRGGDTRRSERHVASHVRTETEVLFHTRSPTSGTSHSQRVYLLTYYERIRNCEMFRKRVSAEILESFVGVLHHRSKL